MDMAHTQRATALQDYSSQLLHCTAHYTTPLVSGHPPRARGRAPRSLLTQHHDARGTSTILDSHSTMGVEDRNKLVTGLVVGIGTGSSDSSQVVRRAASRMSSTGGEQGRRRQSPVRLLVDDGCGLTRIRKIRQFAYTPRCRRRLPSFPFYRSPHPCCSCGLRSQQE